MTTIWSAQEWSVLPLKHNMSGAGRRCGCATAEPTHAVPEWQHKPLQCRPYEWPLSILPRKRSNTQRQIQRRSWRWAAMLKRSVWQRHYDDERIHKNSVRKIDHCDVTIASGFHIDDVTIAQLLTFEIISGVARNERYIFVYLRPREVSITNEQ